eukprot:GHVT01053967.1.p2 GENE.GHVT01053967.1~~GHVT01053967.1.p2  ORF type:complete len:117 (+),score=0.84 GHVT01053967.1:363-713(+)
MRSQHIDMKSAPKPLLPKLFCLTGISASSIGMSIKSSDSRRSSSGSSWAKYLLFWVSATSDRRSRMNSVAPHKSPQALRQQLELMPIALGTHRKLLFARASGESRLTAESGRRPLR